MTAMNSGGPESRLIDGRFELQQRLGGGGMGLVWRARDNALDREVALKEVRPPDLAVAAADPEGARQMRERVLREARALARFQHPNVVTIHHIVDSPEHPYPWLVMELVHGGSLADRLAHGPLSVPEAARMGRGVLRALLLAHSVGVQHRDVKPANVLLRGDSTPVLTDFGIAAMQGATALTATGALIGSPEYIAPERIRGEEGNPSSDLWSLAMMLYVAVEGHHPLRRATTLATLAAVLDEPLPPPHRAGALGPLLSAMLAKDPAARPGPERIDQALAAAENSAGGPQADPRAWAAPLFPDTPQPTPQPKPHPTQHPAPQPTPHPNANPTSYPIPGPSPYSTPHPSSAPNSPPPAPHNTPHPALNTPGQHSGGHFADRVPTPVPSAYSGQAPVDRPGGGAPAGWPPANHRAGGPQAAPGRRRRSGTVVTSAAVAVAVVGGLTWALLPHGGDGSGDNAAASGGRKPSVSSTAQAAAGGSSAGTGTAAPGSATPTPDETTTDAAPPGNLLTPAGIRTVVAAMSPHLGGGRIKELVVYPGYASAEAPTPTDPKLYDDVNYRDGAVDHSPGGTLDSDDVTVKVSVYNWNVVPALLARAQKTLNVPHPTSRYLIIGPDLFDGTPTISVYLSDDYGSGYLSADPNGKVTRTYPRGS